MKHLRRNRSISVSTPSASASTSTPAVSAPAPLSPPAATKAAHSTAERSRGSHDTPLYARFTTTRRAHDGSGPSLKPLVSGPLALASKRPAQVPVPVPRPIEQQKSSDSRKERERKRDEEKSRAGTPSKPEEPQVQSPKDAGRKEDVKSEKSKGDVDAVKQQVRRMPSDGTALSAGSAGASAAGRHGTRVDGERVLLPARKVTQKRGGASSPFPHDEKNAERSTEREKKSADPPSSPSRDVGGERWNHEEVRAVGERVLLPARKVARKRVDVEGAMDPALDTSRIDSDGVKHTSSKGSNPSSSARANVNETSKTRTGAVEQTQAQARARAMSPEPQASSSSPVAFPPVPAPSPAGPGVSAAAPAHPAAVVVVRNSGSEGQFSTPKRARMHTLATTTPASRPSPVTSDPRGRPEPSKSTERPKQAENEVAPVALAVPKVAEPSLTSQTTTSSEAAGGAPPRRRKYSLRAAFGLPDPPPSSQPEAKASTAASPSHVNTAKVSPGSGVSALAVGWGRNMWARGACRVGHYVCGGGGSVMGPRCRCAAEGPMTFAIVCMEAEIKGPGGSRARLQRSARGEAAASRLPPLRSHDDGPRASSAAHGHIAAARRTRFYGHVGASSRREEDEAARDRHLSFFPISVLS